jgi:hypothetical protein
MENSRRILDINVSSMMQIQRYKSKGLTPYYFNKEMGDKFGLVEFTKPLSRGMNSPKELYLMTDEEVKVISRLTSNVKELIELSMKKAELLKEYIPATIITLMNKSEYENN